MNSFWLFFGTVLVCTGFGTPLGIIILVGVTSLYLFYTEIDLKKNTTNQLDIQDKNLLKK